MWLPTIDVDRRAADGSVRGHAPFNRGTIDERFESRAGLPVSLHRVIEFVGQKIIATDHGHDFAGVRIDGHHRSLHRGDLVELYFELVALLIDFLYDELGEITGLELGAGSAMPPAH